MEAGWLEHAKRVVACPTEHQFACINAGGAPPGATVDSNLRWPGMLGERYETARHRVLCIGQIHLETEWAELRENISTLQPLMNKWIAASVADASFLQEYREKYASYLPLWGPWIKAFGPTLCPFGLGPSDITYVNFARCWQASQSKRLYQTMRCCAGTFPVSEVYEIVKPDAVLVLSGDSVFQKYGRLMAGIPTDSWRNFPGRRSFAMRPADISAMRSWLATRLGYTSGVPKCPSGL